MALIDPDTIGNLKDPDELLDPDAPVKGNLQAASDILNKYNPMQYLPGVETTKNVVQDVIERLFAGGTQAGAAGVRGLQGREVTPFESIFKKGLYEKEPATMQDWFTQQAIAQKEKEYQKELETAKGMGGIKGFLAKPRISPEMATEALNMVAGALPFEVAGATGNLSRLFKGKPKVKPLPEETIMQKLGEAKPETPLAEVLKPERSIDPLLEEARKYKSAEEFHDAYMESHPEKFIKIDNVAKVSQRTAFDYLKPIWEKAQEPSVMGEVKLEPIEVKATEIPKDHQTLVMNLETQKKALDFALEETQFNPSSPIVVDETKRLFQRVGEYVRNSPQETEWIKKLGLSPDEVASQFESSVSQSGRSLKQLSDLIKKIKTDLPEGHPLRMAMEKIEPDPTIWQKFVNIYRTVDDKRRGLMVTQLATAARNAMSQSARVGINLFDDAFQGIMNLPKDGPKKAFTGLMQDLSSLESSVANRDAYLKYLDETIAKFPEETRGLFGTPVSGDIPVTDKAIKFLNTANRLQEYYFRRLAFDSKIRALAKRGGVAVDKVTAPMVREATEFALDMTFANKPAVGSMGSAVLQAYKAFPPLTTVNPFPRFWANAVKFLWDYNPTGYASPLVKKMIGGKLNPGEVTKSLAKATTGTLLLGGAVAIRNSEHAGDKWYEYKVGNKQYDLRAYAPFSTYLFLAEAMTHPEKLGGRDVAQGLLSINRLAGTGLFMIDVLRTDSMDSFLKSLKEFTGSYISGFTVPFRMIKDFLTPLDKDLAVSKVTKGTWTGQAREAIPYATPDLPLSYNILTGEPYTRKGPFLRQLTGLTYQEKTPLESVLQKSGEEQRLQVKTGYPNLDTIIKQKTGKIVKGLNEVLPELSGMAEEDKVDVLLDEISKVKSDVARDEKFGYLADTLIKIKPEERYDLLKEAIEKKRISQSDAMDLITLSKLNKERALELIKLLERKYSR